jgi:SanA protein
MRRRLRIVLVIVVLAILGGIGALTFSWWRVSRCHGLTFNKVAELPHRKVGLVLGCSPRLANGDRNWFFKFRMDAAAELFKSGKVDYLLVSGDNHHRSYDEPTAMKKALLLLGVPESRIFCDYAGLTTLDSVVRAKAVFGQASVTIVSQRFHNERAIYLARAFGLDAIGFNASDIALRYAPRTYLREILSRQRAWLDANIIHRKPRYLGSPVTIGEPPTAAL